MQDRVCLICGQTYTPTSGRQKYCNKPITKKCIVCGKEYIGKCALNESQTCGDPKCAEAAKNGVSNSLGPRKCKGCGEMFMPRNSRQTYCKQPKIKKCPVCGKEMHYICESGAKQTCNIHCQAQYIKEKRNASAQLTTKKCKWCGKEFHPKEIREVYCEGPHYKKCVICGKDFEIDVRGYQDTNTCSKECLGKYIAQQNDYEQISRSLRRNLQLKYGEGVTNPMQIPGVMDKIKQTNLDRYGVEWYTQTDEYHDRVKETDLKKYGVEHHLQAKEVIEKRHETVLEEYGVDNVFQVDEVKEKSKQTSLEKYGYEHAACSPEIIEKVKQSNLNKYGVEHPMMLDEYKKKAEQTNIERYGRRAITQSHIKNIQNWYQFTDNPRAYIESHYDSYPRSVELADDLGVDHGTVDAYLSKHDCYDCIRNARSVMEEEFMSFIAKLDPNIRLIHNDKTAIRPYELDLYFPDYKFAIECDPTATHNSSVADPWGGNPKSRKYHELKSNLCEQHDIFLLHVFGYDWAHNRQVIKSMIRNVLKKNTNLIYARKCSIKEVDWGTAKVFLDTNHRQGNASSPIRLGLFYEDQLVSLMTFGKMRGTIGTGNEDLKDCWELVRFCNILNTSVVGGASKLFNYFIKTYNPKRVRSFSDRAHTRGNLYSTLGFTEVRRSDPGYVWVNVVDDRAYHRSNAQKQNIRNFLKDTSIDLSKTEKEIMIEHGFVQVFDSGTITWEWTAN